ncbi:tripartite tricarboxylate transporter TctB family protein [Alisedimentitalea sp. MJ-SS2]|uniref:tripartite tricarboxylate transporter TctB family protein n=1 Tax=Aliisedimentitalea sp. MJ-SS2 TaxID=3049795 RepID=UPI00290981E9|nr:tripartite tricarboxylate transporter TctB family protein [Alisedimentitalea sp. MJ-SS2]MDU8925764.1 tripartite tricarboxylate transporter TctB family protein [Alisedimentitalea sp. MJ-SS2]
MARVKTLQALFKRYRRPGDVVFAWAALVVAVLLLSQLGAETNLKAGGKLVARPWFWPAVSLGGMAVFAALHLLTSLISERIEGRWVEIWYWIRSLEYAGWFIAYAAIVPIAGYLPSTIVFTLALIFRVGYRGSRFFWAGAVGAVATVLVFKSFLQVKLPAGQVYEYLPDGIRQIMLTYF